MAEIRVERKSGGRRWLWVVVLLLIVAAAAVWYFYFNGRATLNRRGASAAPRSGVVVRAGTARSGGDHT